MQRSFGVLSRGILRIPRLEELAGARICPLSGLRAPRGVDAIAGWGMRPGSERARRYAERHRLPYVALEDGFLRSVGLGADEPPLSMVWDDVGIYYDAAGPSRLERLVRETLDEPALARARALIEGWRRARVSKYNAARDGEAPPRPYVLAIDQTRGDVSVTRGAGGEQSFRRLLEAALDENRDCTVLLKVHPDVWAGKSRGYFDVAALRREARVRVLDRDVHLAGLLEHAKAVYTVSSQAGFEGLLWGVSVRSFGMPFYAGWGLSSDDLAAPARRSPAPLEQLAYAALVRYPHYVDPDTGANCEAERVMEHLALQRRMRARFPPEVEALGFSLRKRPLVRAFLRGSEVRFRRRAAALPAHAVAAVWGSGPAPVARTLRLEDGFLRSVGLGADLVRPLSWVVDELGIYYDATRPSALEKILQDGAFDAALLARAAAFRQRIVETGISKYNLDGAGWERPAGGRRVVLAVGQVETDAAVRLGTPGIRSNASLLRAARAADPEAMLVYKPHPDVVAGLRRPGEGERDAQQLADRVVAEVPIHVLFQAVDEVHVLTSLAGFEALLRGLRVVCHGQPFYAGWGLTEDRCPVARRARRLSLDELVVGTLLLYPTYLSRDGARFVLPERVLEELLNWRQRPRGAASRLAGAAMRSVLRLRARLVE